MSNEAEEFFKRFKIVCLKCGSDNVVLDSEQGIDYGGETGYSPGHISVGCNECKQNDWFLYL